MALLGQASRSVILRRVVIPTQLIERVVVYPRKEPNGKLVLVIHIASDCGSSDTIIKKLYEKAHDEFALAYEGEAATGLERFKWVHTVKGTKLPDKSQTIFLRPMIPFVSPPPLPPSGA